jgi:hypothetical protein
VADTVRLPRGDRKLFNWSPGRDAARKPAAASRHEPGRPAGSAGPRGRSGPGSRPGEGGSNRGGGSFLGDGKPRAKAEGAKAKAEYKPGWARPKPKPKRPPAKPKSRS